MVASEKDRESSNKALHIKWSPFDNITYIVIDSIRVNLVMNVLFRQNYQVCTIFNNIMGNVCTIELLSHVENLVVTFRLFNFLHVTIIAYSHYFNRCNAKD